MKMCHGFAIGSFCVLLCANLVVTISAHGQVSNPAAPGSSTSTSTSTDATPPAPSVPIAASGPSTLFNGPLSDYVPCIFRDDDEFAMRAQDLPEKLLDYRAAENLFDIASNAIQPILGKYSQSRDFLEDFKDYYSKNLSPVDLVGKTQDQAINHIQLIVNDAIRDAAEQAQGEEGKEIHSDEEVKDAKEKAASLLTTALETAERNNKTLKPVDAGRAAIKSKDLNLTDGYRQALLEKYDVYTNESNTLFPLSRVEDVEGMLRKAINDTSGYPFSTPPTSLANSPQVLDLKVQLATVTKQAAKLTETTAKQFQPPNDVSCSMAVMSWKETSDIFGRRVANTFIAIQVTLRNLNTKNEFLVHDIQVAVDTGMTQDYFGRFQAGRDKLLVRAVAQRGQSDDRRNRVLNTLQTVGAIGAASSLVAGTVEFKDAVAVFQGAFLTGFANIFPDHTVEQLNHINDLVFSASNTSKVVVPVQGSVPLVTFISEKPIEQLPFAWCGRLPHKGINPKQFFGWGADRVCNFNGGKHNPGYVTPYRYNRHGEQQPLHNAAPFTTTAAPTTDVNHSSSTPLTGDELRTKERDEERTTREQERKSYPLGPTINQAHDQDGVEDGLPAWDDLKYKDWRGAAVRMLQEHTFVVVGGVHIQQVVTQPQLANLNCPHLKTNQIDLSQAQKGAVVCSVSGTGLGLISAINLQKSDAKIPGTIAPGTDGNTAALQFKPEDLCGAEGPYSLFVTYKSDTQKEAAPFDTGLQVLLTPQPAITGATFSGGTLTLNGKCMEQIKAVSIIKDKTSIDGTILSDRSDKEKLTATFVKPAVGSTYSVAYKIGAQTELITPESLSVTATADSASKDTAASANDVTLTPTNLVFTSQKVNTESASKSVTLKNSGNNTLTTLQITVGGPNSPSFAKTTTCASTLASGASCAIKITFKPKSAEKMAATLTITYTGGESSPSKSVSLSGAGTP